MPNDQSDDKARLKRRADTAAAALLTVLLLSGCATSGPPGVSFSDQPLSANRYRVTVSGRAPRNNAGNDLLRHAAEITVRAGYTHFALGAEDVQSRTYYYPLGDTYLHGPDYGRRAGLWPEYPNVPDTLYSASADVVLLGPDEAAGNPRAIEARGLL